MTPRRVAPAMDEARLDAMVDQLVAWGLVEEVEGDLRPTRRWGARLMAAAEKLNLLAAKGQAPQGNPLALAVRQALAAENLTSDEKAFQDAAETLLLLELSRMKPSKRAQAGFPHVRFPGDVDDGGSGVDFHAQPP